MAVSCAVALAVALAMCAAARPVARRLGIVDRPHARKIHRETIPYLGGVGMFFGLAAGMAAFAWLAPDAAFIAAKPLRAIATGAALVCAVGVWDDLRGMKALPKLTFEFLLAAFMWLNGLRVERVTLPTGQTLDLGTILAPAADLGAARAVAGALGDWAVLGAVALSLAITIFWYALLMNAINLIDGLDGLAASVSAVSAVVIVMISTAINHPPPFAVALAGGLTAAVCLGFLKHNWHPATIFMGDAGALQLGFLLASISLLSSTKSQTLLTLLVPLLAVGLPVIESAHSFARRVLTGKNPFQADRRHLHHRLLDLGLSHRRVVSILLYVTILLGLVSFLLATIDAPTVTVFTVLLLGAGFAGLVENLNFLERNLNGAAGPKGERASAERSDPRP